MRIVGGRQGGRLIVPPKNLRARPTTDFAKENLFNVLGNMVDFEEIDVLDLFAGTGSISYEFASRGARSVIAVEVNSVHYEFIKATAARFGFVNLHPVKANAFLYLKNTDKHFDVIFSDAPYDLKGADEVINLVFERGLLREGVPHEGGTCSAETFDDRMRDNEARDGHAAPLHDGGILVFEHSKESDFSAHPNFLQRRSYGSVQFSIFRR